MDEYIEEIVICHHCDESIAEDESIEYGDHCYCDPCYSDLFIPWYDD